MMLICPLVFRMLTPDAEVRTLAVQALRIGLLAEPLYGVSIVAAGRSYARRGRYAGAKFDESGEHFIVLTVPTDAIHPLFLTSRGFSFLPFSVIQ